MPGPEQCAAAAKLRSQYDPERLDAQTGAHSVDHVYRVVYRHVLRRTQPYLAAGALDN